VKLQSAWYAMIEGILYRTGYTQPLLKCLLNFEAGYVIKEIHERLCGNHSKGRILAHKVVRVEYYWPTMSKDSAELVKHCYKCQRFVRVMKNPFEKMSSVSSPWPFAKLGVDIVGLMPRETKVKNF
jgi:hypothetical protein